MRHGAQLAYLVVDARIFCRSRKDLSTRGTNIPISGVAVCASAPRKYLHCYRQGIDKLKPQATPKTFLHILLVYVGSS
jgi:hypothetical protein